LSRSNTGTD